MASHPSSLLAALLGQALHVPFAALIDAALFLSSLPCRIDEVHTLVGAGASGGKSGSAGGGLDIANLMKPALARGEFQVGGIVAAAEEWGTWMPLPAH